MANVFDVLKSSGGSLPLNELAIRSSDEPEEIAKSLDILKQNGVVKIDGDMPSQPDGMKEAYETIVELTDLGPVLS